MKQRFAIIRGPLLIALLVFCVALAPLGWVFARMKGDALRRDRERLSELALAGRKALWSDSAKHQAMMQTWCRRIAAAAPVRDDVAWAQVFDGPEHDVLGRFRSVGYARRDNGRLIVCHSKAGKTGEALAPGTDLATLPPIVAVLQHTKATDLPMAVHSTGEFMVPGIGSRVIGLISFEAGPTESGVLFVTLLPEDFIEPIRTIWTRVGTQGGQGNEVVHEENLPGVVEGIARVELVTRQGWESNAALPVPAPGANCLGSLADVYVLYHPGPNFARDSLAGEARVVLGGGALVALLLAVLAWMQASQGRVLRREVHRQTALLRETNEELVRFKSIAETTSDFVGMCELNGTPIYVNQAGRALLGIAPDEPVELFEFERIYPPQTMALFHSEGFAHSMEKGPWSCDLDLRHRDGHDIPVSFVGFVVKSPDGRPLHMGSMARDISVRQQLDRELREANAALTRFEAIVETTSDLVGLCTLDGVPVYMNRAGRAFLGIGAEESLHEFPFNRIYTQAALDLFDREGIPYAMEHGAWSAEINMRHRDDRELPVSFVGFVINSPEGRPLHLGVMARDITQRHQLDLQLRASLQQQRDLVQMKSQFVNTVSHEFRTPLGVILSSADILTHYLDRLTPATRQEHLGDIHRSSKQMSRMLETVLDLGRIDAGKFACTPCAMDLVALLQRITDESLSASRGGDVKLALADGLTGGHGDETLLRHIFLNLLSNARKYSPPDAAVTFAASRDDQHAVFTVRDEGIGIPAADLATLFEAFARGTNVGDRPGTGLGLAIVKRCAELHGGTIHITSDTGRGTLATVRLPLFEHLNSAI